MIKKILAGLLAVGLLASFLMPVLPVLAADAQLYEGYSAGNDEAVELYGNIWGAQTFTTGTEAHSVTSVRLLLYREGSPSTVTVSIRKTTATDPSGVDLTSGTLNGNNFTDAVAGVWYAFDVTPYSLEASTMYAIVVRATAGNVTNSVWWNSDGTAGAEANGQEETSANGGITWTGDADDDFMFEIWGEPIFEVLGAQVFNGYISTGDWLIVLTYDNEYTPYYPTENPASYFYIRLLDGAVLKAQTSCVAWGHRPASIYLSKALADTLEWGAADYTIRLYGDFGANPYSDYLLVVADWGGAIDSFLDAWVIEQANIIGDDIGIDLTITIADKGEVLNALGHIIFSIGIPHLNEVRPELFEQVSQKPSYEEEDYTHALQGETVWTTRVGAQIAATLTDAGGLIGVTGDVFGGIITFIAFILVVSLLTLGGHLVIGLGVGYPILLAGAWFGLLSWIIAGVITFLAVAIFVYKVWLVR